MRIVFMGTPEFAVPSLRALSARHDVIAVYTRPDAVSGRGRRVRPSAVKSLAEELGLNVVQPASLRDAEALAELKRYGADIIIVAAYGAILPPQALEAARLGAINVHASLLPRWRGAAPIQRAILAGDDVVGVSIMRMEAGLDTGPYCLQDELPVGESTARDLTARLSDVGASALVRALPSIEAGGALWVAQDEALVTYADKITKDDVAVGPDMLASDVAVRIRASMPAAPSRVLVGGRGVTLLDASPTDEPLGPGTIGRTTSALLLGARDGGVAVTRVKPDGKAEMDACAWVRGLHGLETMTWERLR